MLPKLRVSALNLMAPLAAFDHTTHKQLLQHHLANIQTFPDSLLQSLKAGAFTVLGRKGHAVALDKTHQMCINKDMKYAVVKEYLQKLLLRQIFHAAPNAAENYRIYELNRTYNSCWTPLK